MGLFSVAVCAWGRKLRSNNLAERFWTRLWPRRELDYVHGKVVASRIAHHRLSSRATVGRRAVLKSLLTQGDNSSMWNGFVSGSAVFGSPYCCSTKRPTRQRFILRFAADAAITDSWLQLRRLKAGLQAGWQAVAANPPFGVLMDLDVAGSDKRRIQRDAGCG